MKDKFATCINCIDGRVQLPVISFIKKAFKVNFVDMITEPGADKILARYKDKTIVSAIRKKAILSVQRHNSVVIAVVGHYDCLANPVSKTTHLKQIKSSVEKIRKWFLDVPVVGLWVDDSWQAHKLK